MAEREIWVHELEGSDGEFGPMGMGELPKDDTGMCDGLAAGYRLKKDARKAGRIPKWGKTHHRLVRYIPAPASQERKP